MTGPDFSHAPFIYVTFDLSFWVSDTLLKTIIQIIMIKKNTVLLAFLLLLSGLSAQENILKKDIKDYYKLTLIYHYNDKTSLDFTAVWDSVIVKYGETHQFYLGGISLKDKPLDTTGKPLGLPYIDLTRSDDAIILSMLPKGDKPASSTLKFRENSMLNTDSSAYFEWEEGYYLPPQISYYKSDVTTDEGMVKSGFYFEWAFDIRKHINGEKKQFFLVSSFKLYKEFEKSCKKSLDAQTCNITIQDAKISKLNAWKIKRGKSFSFSKKNFGGATYKVIFRKIEPID